MPVLAFGSCDSWPSINSPSSADPVVEIAATMLAPPERDITFLFILFAELPTILAISQPALSWQSYLRRKYRRFVTIYVEEIPYEFLRGYQNLSDAGWHSRAGNLSGARRSQTQ
jgi:hypothetical protein